MVNIKDISDSDDDQQPQTPIVKQLRSKMKLPPKVQKEDEEEKYNTDNPNDGRFDDEMDKPDINDDDDDEEEKYEEPTQEQTLLQKDMEQVYEHPWWYDYLPYIFLFVLLLICLYLFRNSL